MKKNDKTKRNTHTQKKRIVDVKQEFKKKVKKLHKKAFKVKLTG